MKRCLCFGLNEVSPSAYGGWQGWLRNPVNDARAAAALLARAHFESRAVFNLDCTIARLRAEFSNDAEDLKDGDTFCFYYSGHGGRAPAMSGYKETLCLADGELADTALLELFAAFKPGVRVVLISDSCHSGGLSRTVPPSRDKPIFVLSTVELPTINLTRGAPMLQPGLLIAACADAELASDGEGKNGAFTAAWLQIADDIVSTGHSLTWCGWIESVQRYMAREFATQHPVFQPFGAPSEWDADVLQ